MLGITNFGAFLVSGIILNITPGSDTIYILSRSISSGKKAGIMSVLGVSSGIIGHTLLAAFGLSALLSRSAAAFNVIKYAGVLYLIYLGIKTLLSSENQILVEAREKHSLKQVYMQGFLTNLLNPKVALFFLAFLPQFVDPGAGLGPLPFIVLGCTFVTTGTLWCLLLAGFSSFATDRLRNNGKITLLLNKLCGFIYIGLGLKLLRVKSS